MFVISSSDDALSLPVLEVFNDTFAHLPWNICYKVFDWPLNFFQILWVIVVHIVFTVYPQKEVKWTDFGERGDHGNALFLEITFSPNKSLRCLIVAVAVWGVAPSWWNHWLSNRRSWRRCNNPWKVSITLRYRSWLIVTLSPCSWNNRGPIMPLALKAHHAVHLSLWRGRSLTSFGASLPHILQFWELTIPFKLKCASSVKQTFLIQSLPFPIPCRNRNHNDNLAALSVLLNSYTVWHLYGFFKILSQYC